MARKKATTEAWDAAMDVEPEASTEAATKATKAEVKHFSTYLPRALQKRLRVYAVVNEVPVWQVVTAALEAYLADREA